MMPRPPVSIIILTFNKVAYTKNCLTRLREVISSDDEVIVSDNASTDETPQYMEKLRKEWNQVVYRRSEFNLGFAGGCNCAVSPAKHDRLLLLNNDTFPVNMFLDEMVEALTSDTGVVGAKLLNPDGTIQHVGVRNLFEDDGWKPVVSSPQGLTEPHPCLHFLTGVPDAFVHGPGGVEELEAVTGACLLTTKEWWEKVGGLDEGYELAQYEDIDYCMKVRAAGGKIVYQPSAVLVHYHHVSFEPGCPAGQKHDENRKRLITKWGSTQGFVRRLSK